MCEISLDLNLTMYRKLEKVAESEGIGIEGLLESFFAREVATPKLHLVYRKPYELPFCCKVATPICGLEAE